MQRDFEKIYHELEKEHFWFKARRKYILNALQKADKNATILDIGCSSGILLNELSQIGFKSENLYGIDISEKAISNCRNAGLSNTFLMDAQNIDLKQKFDFIIASDCLEHIEDDEKALRNWNELLQPNGVAYIFVPAFMSLWSQHDEVNMHFRRYERNELNNKLKKNGFQITKSSFWNFFLFLPIYLVRRIGSMRSSNTKESGDLKKLPLFNSVLFTLLNLENKLLQRFTFPFGVSSYAVVKKATAKEL